MNKFENIIWEYYDLVIPRNEWWWQSLYKGSSIHYLFYQPSFTILTISKEPNPHYSENFMIGEYYCHHSKKFNEIASMFGEENLEICFKVFVKWIDKNIPFNPDNISVIKNDFSYEFNR